MQKLLVGEFQAVDDIEESNLELLMSGDLAFKYFNIG